MGFCRAAHYARTRGTPLLWRAIESQQRQDSRASGHRRLAIDDCHSGRAESADFGLSRRVREVGVLSSALAKDSLAFLLPRRVERLLSASQL